MRGAAGLVAWCVTQVARLAALPSHASAASSCGQHQSAIIRCRVGDRRGPQRGHGPVRAVPGALHQFVGDVPAVAVRAGARQRRRAESVGRVSIIPSQSPGPDGYPALRASTARSHGLAGGGCEDVIV